MYREDHTNDCWINLLRLPIITIVTSSLYNHIISLCNKACNKGLRIEKLAKCRYMIPMLRFRYFQLLLLPGFYSIVFFLVFLFLFKKSKNNINPRTYKGVDATPFRGFSEVFLSFFLEAKTSAPGVFSSCSFIPCAHFESSSVMVSLCLIASSRTPRVLNPSLSWSSKTFFLLKTKCTRMDCTISVLFSAVSLDVQPASERKTSKPASSFIPLSSSSASARKI